MAFGSIDKIVNYRYRVHGAQQTRSAMQRLSTAAAAIAAASLAAGVAVFRMADRFTQAAAKIEDLSRATGIAASELATLGYIAEQDGGSIDSMANAIRRMTRTIDDANDGLTTYIRSFDAIGIEAEDLEGLAPEQQFYRIAQAISEMEDDSKRLAIAQEIFGRSAMSLIPTLNRGEEGLREMGDRAAELGIILDDEAYAASKRFQDALTEMRARGEAALVDALVPMLPVLIELAETLGEMATSIIPAVGDAIEAMLPILQDMLGFLGTALEGWEMIFDSVKSSSERWNEMMITATRDQEAYNRVWERLGGLVGTYGVEIEETTGEVDEGTEANRSYSSSVDDVAKRIFDAGNKTEKWAKALLDAKAAMQMEGAKGITPYTTALEEAAQKRQQIIIETGRNQVQDAQQVAEIWTNGAYQMGRILSQQGADFGEQMLRLVAQLALEFAKMQLGKSLPGPAGLLFNFVGGLI